ncbi:hypothetical protein LTR17_002085 [Elasticomyces elasticus]|nr:hypothetical protein LTR17_002085 [Elasticomyces elasticus]
MSSPNMPLLGHMQHSDANVTSPRLPRNFSKPFASPSSPVFSHTVHEIQNDFDAHPLFTWPTPTSSPPLRRKSPYIDLVATDYGKLAVSDTVTRVPARLAPIERPQQLAPSLLQACSPVQQRQQQLYPPTSPSLASSITTLQSTPTHSPLTPGGAEFEEESVQISTKRKFPFSLAKRLPRHITDEWFVYATVVDKDIGRAGHSGESDSESESEGEVGEAEEVPLVTDKKGRAVRFAGVEKDTSSSIEQSTSGEDKTTANDSTFTLSKFKFPPPPGHNWSGTFGHFAEPTPPTSPATLHYRGASFDVVNPHASLLLGKHDIETPAEIDGLLDDYFTNFAEMAYSNGDISSLSLNNSSQDGSRRGRMLYADPECARRNIMRLPSAAFTDAGPAHESPLAGKGHASTLPTGAMGSNEFLDSQAQQHIRHGSVAQAMPDPRESSVYDSSRLSDPFDLYLSDDEAGKPNKIDDVVSQEPRISVGVYTQEVQDRETARWAAAMAYEETGELPEGFDDEGADADADADATAYHYDRESTIGNIVEAYDHTAHSAEEAARRAGIQYFPELDGKQMGIFGYRYPDGGYEHARHPPPGLPAPLSFAHRQFQYDNTELPTSEQTYDSTRELLRFTPEHDQHYIPPYPDANGMVYPTYDRQHYSTYPPIPYRYSRESFYPEDYEQQPYYPTTPHNSTQGNYLPQQEATPPTDPYNYKQTPYYPYGPYYSHDNKENVPPNDSAVTLQAPGQVPPLAQLSAVTIRPTPGVPAIPSKAGVEAPEEKKKKKNRIEIDWSIPRRCDHQFPKAKREPKPEDLEGDEVWVDIDPEDDPAHYMKDVWRESGLSYANTSDAGDATYVGPWVGADCCVPDYEGGPNFSLQAKRYSDGWIAHPPLKAHEGPKIIHMTLEEYNDIVEEAITLFKQVMREKQLKAVWGGDGNPAAEIRENRLWMCKLEKMMETHSTWVKDAADRIAWEVPNMKPEPGRSWHNGFDAHECYAEIVERLHLPKVDTHKYPKAPPSGMPKRGTQLGESKQKLLSEPPAVYDKKPLEFSNTFSSFTTVKERSPRSETWLLAEDVVQKPRPAKISTSGHGTPSTKHVISRVPEIITPTDSQRTGLAEEYELNELTRCVNGTGLSRPAISGQTSLKPLQLLGNTTAMDSSTTSFVPGRRMTDSDLIQREPNWTMSPSSRAVPRTAFELPADAKLVQPMLMSREEARGLAMEAEQKRISNRYFVLTAFFPITALLFGLGRLDWVAKKVSNGRVDGMEKQDKYWARFIAAPLGMMFYAIIAIFVVLMVVVVR